MLLKISQYSQRQKKLVLLESLLRKTVGVTACNFLTKRLQHKLFSVNIAKYLITAFFIEHLSWLLLNKLRHLSKTMKMAFELNLSFETYEHGIINDLFDTSHTCGDTTLPLIMMVKCPLTGTKLKVTLMPCSST